MENSSHEKKPNKKIDKPSSQKKKTVRGKFVRIPGIDEGKVVIKPDFDTPLPEF